MKIERFREKDNKKKFIVCFTIICIALVVGVFLYHSYAWYEDEKTFNSFSGNVTPVGDIYFSVYVNNVASETIPQNGTGYTFDHADCTNNATLTWNDTSWSPKISNLTSSRTKCSLYFAKDNRASAQILAFAEGVPSTSTAVINKDPVYEEGTSNVLCTNTLAYDDYANIRYVGANPCNYISFNDELWRIIGVFNNKLKIMRNSQLPSLVYDTSASGVNSGGGINQWGESGTYTGADLMKLLNPGFDNNPLELADGTVSSTDLVNNSLYWNRTSGNCYYNQNNTYATTCDFTEIGLKTNYKSIISRETWYLGAPSNVAKVSLAYDSERNASPVSFSDGVTRTTSWEGYVGLPYLSDYGYAVGGSNRSTCLEASLDNYRSTDSGGLGCYQDIWMVSSSLQLLSPSANYSSSVIAVIIGGASGVPVTANASTVWPIKPVVHLDASIEFSGGNGSSISPYIIDSRFLTN